MKIVFFGDSLTWGGYGGSYFSHLADLLPDHTLINAGQGGNTVINLLERLERDVLAQQPDGVFIMIGGNDAIAFSQPQTRAYYRQSQNLPDGFLTPDDFEAAFRDLLTRLHLAHILVWVGLEPMEYNAAVVDALNAFNERIRSAARAFNIPMLDLMEHFPPPADLPERPDLAIGDILTVGSRTAKGWDEFDAAQSEGGYTYSFDGIHFTDAAARRAAELIADFIRESSPA
jgi:lysophospholipase L1-like esterase